MYNWLAGCVKNIPADSEGDNKGVCQKWSEHEDGVLAYRLQNEEISSHYGRNRFNRRVARNDVPIAKVIQIEEEKKHQEERMQQLKLLHQRSQEDQKIAQQVYQEFLKQEQNDKSVMECDDEELARQMQEKEKRKYDRYLEKKRERQLKREREKIEKKLAEQSEEARLTTFSPDAVEDLRENVDNLHLKTPPSNVKVRHSGQLEDNGDFSDFYVLPPTADVTEQKLLQEYQDEELAQLIQEQEHKRTKAIVDQRKLREIELHDARLAEIIQEQEKIKSRRVRGRRERAADERQANKDSQINGHRNRPQSMTEVTNQQSSSSPDVGRPVQAQHGSAASHISNSISSTSQQSKDHHHQVQRTVSLGNTSACRKAASKPPHSHISHSMKEKPSDRSNHSDHHASYRNGRQTMGVIPNGAQNGNDRGSECLYGNGSQPAMNRRRPPPGPARLPSARDSLNNTEAHNVEHWLTGCPVEYSPKNGHSQKSPLREWEAELMGDHLSEVSSRGSTDLRLPSPSPPDSSHSEHDPSSLSSGSHDQTPCRYPASNPISCSYNIATAIDPTYKRRQHEIHAADETEPKISLMLSRSLPLHADTDLEWDPGLRGSLRRPKVAHWKHIATLHGGTTEEEPVNDDDLNDGMTGTGQQIQPVPGQRRAATIDRNKKLKKPTSKNGTCRQQ
ncbi:zinc finger CCCH domain-containing protein 13 isoform X2 [Octopus sinensis]|uniref:Zinc finger CCCH domain-containing protein 13 isoform X2 n=1 Tax=Octopus sinensis TaxID=2607531 RepID=A0A6P7TP07_9MOLL|nr:zinc finger CCCH domain-containing protein 13 isoform X2 [Octopus sinensis]